MLCIWVLGEFLCNFGKEGEGFLFFVGGSFYL